MSFLVRCRAHDTKAIVAEWSAPEQGPAPVVGDRLVSAEDVHFAVTARVLVAGGPDDPVNLVVSVHRVPGVNS